MNLATKNCGVTTGLLIHGRHLQAHGWAKMLWGEPHQDELGSLPAAVLCILNEGVTRVKMMTIGTGASALPDGTREAEAIKRLLVENFDALEDFTAIREHPLWPAGKEALRTLANEAAVDTKSQNTAEEIANAAQLFSEHGVVKVIEICGVSHAPRCQTEQGKAKASGTIPKNQQWLLMADDMPYAGTQAGDMLVFEAPHRGDDPVLALSPDLWPAKVFGRFLSLPVGVRPEFLRRVTQLANELQNG